MRSGCAQLRVGPCGTPEEDLPLINPIFNWENSKRAYESGTEYRLIFFAGPIGYVDVCGSNDPYRGFFADDEERQRIFTECLDQIEAKDIQAIEMGIDPYCGSQEECTCQ
jgi:hypothetical protein